MHQILVLVSLVFVVVACEGEKAEALRKESKEAAEAAGEYFVEQKDKIVGESQEEIDRLSERIDALRAKLAGASEEAKRELSKKIEGLEKKKGDAVKKLEALRHATAENWDNLREGFSSAVAEFRKAFDDQK